VLQAIKLSNYSRQLTAFAQFVFFSWASMAMTSTNHPQDKDHIRCPSPEGDGSRAQRSSGGASGRGSAGSRHGHRALPRDPASSADKLRPSPAAIVI
jgi:hypothetical protein